MTDFYRLTLTRPEIGGLHCAPQTPRELAELAAAMDEGPLTPEQEQQLLELGAAIRRMAPQRT